MNYSNIKCVLVIDKDLPLGLIANTAAILGCSLNDCVEGIVGNDVIDKSNFTHKGIINIPLPILSSTSDKIKDLSNTIKEKYSEEVIQIGFNNIAQKCKNYEEYTEKLSSINSDELNYLGVCIYGNKKTVQSLTGSLGSLK